MSDLRRILELRRDSDLRLLLELDDWEHKDYIEDVLAEHFDIDYEYSVENESGKYVLHFSSASESSAIESAIDSINKHHASKAELYATI